MVGLDSDPTKLISIVGIGGQLLITSGACSFKILLARDVSMPSKGPSITSPEFILLDLGMLRLEQVQVVETACGWFHAPTW